MKPLSKELRNKFERTIENAREIAEEAARIALEQLGVGEASPYSYLSEDERALRKRLRAHGRNLGDVRDPKTETQEIDRLVEEIAYEHWHRMLFARFLAENDLLMYYEDDDIENAVPVTLSECDELAQELGMKNGWEVAAKFATKMLPQVFRADSPVFEVELPPEKQRQLEKLVSDIEGEIFNASDSLGWTYQFWQSKRKKEINSTNEKIGEKALPTVTQLFTDSYMVDFLVDNTLGAWWAKDHLTREEIETFNSEEDIRNEISINNITFDYLRIGKDKDSKWTFLSNVNESLTRKNLSELKILDPCCGSGHFLVAIFLKLVPIRMKIENLSEAEACDLVLHENLHGLEIDKRCVEIAVFALALEAWKYPNTNGFRKLPEMHISWCGQAINMKREDWLELVRGNSMNKIYLDILYDLFKSAPILGSLINPDKVSQKNSIKNSIYEKGFYEAKALLGNKKKDKDTQEVGIMAKGIEKTFQLLSNKYHWIATNVPYLKRGKQDKILQEYCERYYFNSKDELATVFAERCLELLHPGGRLSLVMPQFWTFHARSKKLREELLNRVSIEYAITLGTNAFETISGEIVNVGLYSFVKCSPDKFITHGIDVSEAKTASEKATMLKTTSTISVLQKSFMDNIDMRIIFDVDINKESLADYATSAGGLQTFDKPRFIQYHWEQKMINDGWEYLQSTIKDTKLFAGREGIILWEDGSGELYQNVLDLEAQGYKSGVWKAGTQVWGKKGVLFKLMGEKLEATIYSGYPFENTTGVIIPKDERYLPAIWCYCSSQKYTNEIRKIDKKVAVTNGNLVKVNFDYNYWKSISNQKYPNGLPKQYSDDPTQWIFHGHPRKSIDPLQVAVARLLGYRWPAELDDDMELSEESRELIAQSQGLLPYADKDGIVCIPSVRGETPASERLLNLLAAAYKDEDINKILSELLSNADHAGKSLESWLRDKFFTQHYKLFGHRPFIWQIWDGLKDGFSVLVNYHKLDRKNLETLIYTYLGDWISKQKSAMMDGIEGAEEKLNAAISLKKKLELILEGEAPYDIFVRWKPLNKQPLGWEPDLNDGVRVNIRPFMLVGDVGKKGAGVLRDKPNIKWNKDRGKDTENSPWYHLFGGDRINDYHLTLEEKKKAKEDEVKFS